VFCANHASQHPRDSDAPSDRRTPGYIHDASTINTVILVAFLRVEDIPVPASYTKHVRPPWYIEQPNTRDAHAYSDHACKGKSTCATNDQGLTSNRGEKAQQSSGKSVCAEVEVSMYLLFQYL